MTDPSHYRQALDVLPHIVWAAGLDGALEYMNRRAAEYFGLPLDDLLGWDWGWVVHPADLSETLRGMSNAIRTGGPQENEFRLRRHDGEYRWFRGRAEPVRDAHSRVVRWIGTCTDIDESKRAMDRMARVQAMFRALVERSADGLALVGPDGTVRYANPAAAGLLGRRADELAGADLWGSVAPGDRDEMGRWWEQVLAAPGEGSSRAAQFLTWGSQPCPLRVLATNLLPDPDVRAVAVQMRPTGGGQ